VYAKKTNMLLYYLSYCENNVIRRIYRVFQFVNETKLSIPSAVQFVNKDVVNK
jgi:hypothetical protein